MVDQKEKEFYQEFCRLKEEAGLHSPSVHKLLKSFPEVGIRIDACFLCNPYAFELFYQRFTEEDMQKYIQFYPPQNHEVAENIGAFRGLPPQRILVGNGAIEMIEHLVVGQRVVFPLPTFSSYYEQLEGKADMFPYQLQEEDDFCLHIDQFIRFIEEKNPDLVILVNPNNPTGTLVPQQEVIRLHQALRHDQRLIVDESFIDFAGKDHSVEQYSLAHTNLYIIRSLSKDFGIAGLRLGYAVLPEEEVKKCLQTGFLWNTNGIAYYFTELLADSTFQREYAKARRDYNQARDIFYQELKRAGVDVVPSQANFFMIRTPDDPGILFSKLLYTHGIYTRILNDKWGLEGNWLRIASKDKKENRQMLHAIRQIWKR